MTEAGGRAGGSSLSSLRKGPGGRPTDRAVARPGRSGCRLVQHVQHSDYRSGLAVLAHRLPPPSADGEIIRRTIERRKASAVGRSRPCKMVATGGMMWGDVGRRMPLASAARLIGGVRGCSRLARWCLAGLVVVVCGAGLMSAGASRGAASESLRADRQTTAPASASGCRWSRGDPRRRGRRRPPARQRPQRLPLAPPRQGRRRALALAPATSTTAATLAPSGRRNAATTIASASPAVTSIGWTATAMARLARACRRGRSGGSTGPLPLRRAGGYNAI